MDSILLLGLVAVFGVFVFLNGRKRKAQIAQLESSVVIGANVIMLGGIKGKIVAVSDSSVVVETTPGTKIEFVRAAVRQVIEPSLDTAQVTAKKPTAKPAAKATGKSTTAKKTAK
ncbi:MAG: preprotein translocase subunit YajC [Actinobacteria bacterium]|nr:preprotein translocase subunit YajC [Actinomycetota bacterium]